MQQQLKIASPLTLPCGLVLKNRLAKAAMTEQLAPDGNPNDKLARLYARFDAGGAGLVITGNVMIAREHREHPRNVVFDDKTDVAAVKAWREASPSTALIAQLSHPGRQAMLVRSADGFSLAPSAIALKGLGPVFTAPRALTLAEIDDVIARFAYAAKLADDAGFSGVQLHGAHGYLLSQFLSPLANVRTDQYGGSLENRARFLLAVVDAVRARIGKSKALLVKLNSADFQKGGFDEDDALAVMGMLEKRGVDLLEISGGSYEAPAMVGLRQPSTSTSPSSSTQKREAYFLDLAERARKATSLPLMLTGGFRTPDAMESAVAGGAVDVIGLARPIAVNPDFPNQVLAGDSSPAQMARDKLGVKSLDSMLAAQMYVEQMHLASEGKPARPNLSRVWTLAHAAWMSRLT